MTFKELALKMLKEFPDGIWVHFHNMPDGCRMDCETYLDADSLDDFEGRLKEEVADYYIDDFAYDMLVVTLKADIELCTIQKNISNCMQIMQKTMQRKFETDIDEFPDD